MQVVKMNNDMCAIFPKEWEIIKTQYYKNECNYAGVVWVQNSRELPVFVFFWNKPISTMSIKDKKNILDAVCMKWKCFSDYIYDSAFAYIYNNQKNKSDVLYTIHFFDMEDMMPSNEEVFAEGVQAGMYTFWAKHMHHGWPAIIKK